MEIAIWNARVDGVFVDRAPFALLNCVATTTRSGLPAWRPRSAPGSESRSLMRRENDKPQSFVDKRVQYSVVARSFRQPQRFSFASEAESKISQSPTDLGAQIAFVAQSENRVAISLR